LPSLIRKVWFIPLVLTLFALALRLVGIGWGLKNDLHNQSYHPDELPILAASQQIEPSQLKFTPGFYNYGTLYLTLLRVESMAVAAYGGRAAGDDADAEWTYVSRCHLAGRVLSAIAGALTVLFLFLMLRRWVNDVGATMGALLVAVAPAHVMHSRFQTVDVLGMLLLVVSIWFALKLLPAAKRDNARAAVDEGSDDLHPPTPSSCLQEEGETEPTADARSAWRSEPWCISAAAGAFAGLSASTKYTGGLAILALFAVLFVVREKGWVKQLLAGVGACVVAFIVGTPGVLLDSARFWRDFSYEMQHTASGHGLVFAGMPSGFFTQITNLLVGIGPFLVLLGLIGLGLAARRKQVWVWAVLAFAVPYYVLIGRSEVMFLRYSFPLYVGLAAGFGFLMAAAHETRGRLIWVVMLGITGLGGIDPGGLRAAATMTVQMASEDPRDAAARYLKEQAKGKPDVAVGLVSDPWFYTPPLYPDTNLPRAVPQKDREALMLEAREPKIDLLVPDGPSAVLGWDAAKLEAEKPQFVVFSSYETVDRLRLAAMKDLPAEFKPYVGQTSKFIDQLEKTYERDKILGGGLSAIHDYQYPSPTLEIWRRKSPKSTSP
jgi:hypothetical protein